MSTDTPLQPTPQLRPITVGDKLHISRGCPKLGIRPHQTLTIKSVQKYIRTTLEFVVELENGEVITCYSLERHLRDEAIRFHIGTNYRFTAIRDSKNPDEYANAGDSAVYVGIRLSRAIKKAIDAYIDATKTRTHCPTRSEAIRTLIVEALVANGIVDPS